MRIAPVLMLLSLGACAAPEFPRRDTFAPGEAAALAEAQARLAARPGALSPAEIAALHGPLCPDWSRARIPHPIDPITGNPTPSDRLLLGCHNAAALDAMAARPSDLTDPPARMSPASAEAIGRGIERHRTTGPTPLPPPARTVGGL